MEMERLTQSASGLAQRAFGRLARSHPHFVQTVLRSVQIGQPVEDDDVFLARVYDRLLNRSVDPDGLATFRAALRAGTSREDVVLSIALSDEYRARVGNRNR